MLGCAYTSLLCCALKVAVLFHILESAVKKQINKHESRNKVKDYYINCMDDVSFLRGKESTYWGEMWGVVRERGRKMFGGRRRR